MRPMAPQGVTNTEDLIKAMHRSHSPVPKKQRTAPSAGKPARMSHQSSPWHCLPALMSTAPSWSLRSECFESDSEAESYASWRSHYHDRRGHWSRRCLTPTPCHGSLSGRHQHSGRFGHLGPSIKACSQAGLCLWLQGIDPSRLARRQFQDLRLVPSQSMRNQCTALNKAPKLTLAVPMRRRNTQYRETHLARRVRIPPH